MSIQAESQTSKSFLVLFFKKELLALSQNQTPAGWRAVFFATNPPLRKPGHGDNLATAGRVVKLRAFLRRRFQRREVESDFGVCVIAALALAKSEEAGYLPGGCGASTD